MLRVLIFFLAWLAGLVRGSSALSGGHHKQGRDSSPVGQLVITSASSAIGCTGDISDAEYGALRSLYDGTHGSRWKWNTTTDSQVWSFPSELSAPCSGWYGIGCEPTIGGTTSSSPCTVSSLDLNYFGLVGLLSTTDIGGLTGLRNLSLEGNILLGPLPSGICNDMKLLQYFSISGNFFTGLIPDSLYSLTSLQYLYVALNHFSGPLSPAVGNLTNLVQLQMQYNSLSAALPTTLGALTMLNQLYVNNNAFNGAIPSQMWLLTQMVYLFFDNTFVSGSISSSLASMSLLTLLSFSTTLMTGPIPSFLGTFSGLAALYLESCGFSGPIPNELGNLVNIAGIYLGSNSLTGPLPSSLGNLRFMQYLQIESNSLSGSLPDSFSNLTSVLQMYIDHNYLSGQIPQGLCGMHSMYELIGGPNYLSGSILPCIGGMASLDNFQFTLNYFSGTLSPDLASPLMVIFNVENNLITGTLPNAFAQMTAIQYLLIGPNALRGTIPTEYGLLTELVAIEFSGNALSGTIGDDFFRMMPALQSIFLDDNQFTGALPSSFNSTQVLEFCSMSANLFTASVPLVYNQLEILRNIDLNNNFFTGNAERIAWTDWKILQLFDFSNNLFSGTMSSEVGSLEKLEYYNFDFNFLSGTITAGFGGCQELEYIALGGNQLFGSIPLEFTLLTNLQNLNLSGNVISGNIVKLFENATAFPKLNLLDLSDNALTGPLPPQLFDVHYISEVASDVSSDYSTRTSALESVVLYSNCFDSTVPDSVCSATRLRTLVMDSMSQADACKVNFGSARSVIKIDESTISYVGTIADCIWQMPNLQTLHLAGNGLYGTLGNLNSSISVLNDVSLGSNRLVGTIPSSWQESGQFVQLDLSSNKLSGTLSADFMLNSNETDIDLSVNRLSGDIPQVFKDAENVNILDGNLFQCMDGTKPKHDPNSEQYVCGSSDFDEALIVYVVILVVALLGLGGGFVSREAGATPLLEWAQEILSQALFHQLHKSGHTIDRFRQFSVVIDHMTRWVSSVVVGYVCISMVFYIIVKEASTLARYYSTHEYQYAWVTTVAFLHGLAPATASIVFMVVSVGTLRWLIDSAGHDETNMKPLDAAVQPKQSLTKLQISEAVNCESRPTATKSEAYEAIAVAVVQVLVVLIVHMTITITINVAYVYALIKGVSPAALLVLQILLSLFKLSWNQFYVHRGFVLRMAVSSSRLMLCQCFMTLFTFLVSPVIATFFLDYTCFRYVILGQPAVSSSFLVVPFTCVVDCEMDEYGEGVCFNDCGIAYDNLVTAYSSVVPSWLYSYQCSSSILTNYVPVLLFAYVLSGIVFPMLQAVVAAYFEEGPLRCKISKCTQLASSDVPTWVVYLGLLKDIHIDGVKPLVNVPHVVCKLCLNMAVLLTFGLACPLLAVSVCVDAWACWGTWLLAQHRIVSKLKLWQVARATAESGVPVGSVDFRDTFSSVANVLHRDTLTNPNHNETEHWLADVAAVVERDCTAAFPTALVSCIWMVVIVSSIFWGFFVFDMMGDVYGSLVGGYMYVVCMVSILATYWATGLIFQKYSTKRSSSQNAAATVAEYSMNDQFL
jgi:Leucine-rich repeat (LRR) protein